MSCPVLCFINKSPFTDQITASNGTSQQIQPGVPVTLTANVTNQDGAAGGLAQVLFFWASEMRNPTWPAGVYRPNWVVPEVGSVNGEIQIVADGPSVTQFTTLWLPDVSVVPAVGANQNVLIVFAQIITIPVLPVCAGYSNTSSFNLNDPSNGAAMFPYLPARTSTF